MNNKKMKRPQLAIGIVVALVLLSGCASTHSSARWTLLGSRTVNHTIDRDEIRVGAQDGTFRKISLRVRNRRVEFAEVRVHYQNGSVETINIRREIPAGGSTREIDLEGGNRIISKVVFVYRTGPVVGERAVVQLYGRR